MGLFSLYVLTVVLPGIGAASLFIFVTSVAWLFFIAIMHVSDGTRDWTDGFCKALEYTELIILTAIVCFFLSLFIPSQSSIYKMIIFNHVSTHKDIQKMPGYLIDYIKKESK